MKTSFPLLEEGESADVQKAIIDKNAENSTNKILKCRKTRLGRNANSYVWRNIQVDKHLQTAASPNEAVQQSLRNERTTKIGRRGGNF